MFKKTKNKILVAVSIGTAIFVPSICQMVQSQRNTNSMGGELLLFLIPLIVWLIIDTAEKSYKAKHQNKTEKPIEYKIHIIGIDSIDIKNVEEV